MHSVHEQSASSDRDNPVFMRVRRDWIESLSLRQTVQPLHSLILNRPEIGDFRGQSTF